MTLKKAQNYRLQYLRAIAASSVVLYHSSFWLKTIRHEPAEFRIFFGWFGVFGVQLFFAISGLLMARLAGGMAPGRFLAHRIIRIYPIYWLTALVAFSLSRRPASPMRSHSILDIGSRAGI